MRAAGLRLFDRIAATRAGGRDGGLNGEQPARPGAVSADILNQLGVKRVSPGNGSDKKGEKGGARHRRLCVLSALLSPDMTEDRCKATGTKPSSRRPPNCYGRVIEIFLSRKASAHIPGICYDTVMEVVIPFRISSGCPALNNDVANCPTGTSGYLV